MDITLINPPEKLRVWAGTKSTRTWCILLSTSWTDVYSSGHRKKKSLSRRDYRSRCRRHWLSRFWRTTQKHPMDWLGWKTYTHSLPDVQKTIDIVRKYNPNATIVPDHTAPCSVNMRFVKCRCHRHRRWRRCVFLKSCKHTTKARIFSE